MQNYDPTFGASDFRLRAKAAATIAILLFGFGVAIGVGQSGIEAGQSGGTIRGTVRAAAPHPAGTLKVTADHKTCGQTVPDESVLTVSDGGLANAVVVINGLKAPKSAAGISVTNRACRFTPHVQISQPGSRLRIGNDDNTLHTTHAYADGDRSLFNVALAMAGLTLNRTLGAPGIVRLECDSHRWMRGYIFVTDEVAATTGDRGQFELANVQPGTYELRVWHEKLPGASQKVTVSPGATADVTFVLGKTSG